MNLQHRVWFVSMPTQKGSIHGHYFIPNLTVDGYLFLSIYRLQQEQNRAVAQKLYIATGIMFTFPFIVFFISFYFIFHNKTYPESWAGGAAIFAANIVIFGYVYSAFSEEDEEDETGRRNKNDELGPRVGLFKQRTD